jgi:TatD DNase family protein
MGSGMQIIDTHCHIHDPEFAAKYDKPVQQLIDEAKAVGVFPFVAVGTDATSSQLAVEFAAKHQVYASLALHPHQVAQQSPKQLQDGMTRIAKLATAPRVVAIGECGLDYYYHPSKTVQDGQKVLLRQHLDLALQHNLPLIFHIRDAFEDFFEIIDDYTAKGHQLRGVVHSFSAHLPQLMGSLQRGFYISLNGIMTFTKDPQQLHAAKTVPLDKLVLETDAPFLTPNPFRGKMCEISHIVKTAEFLSELRNEPLELLAKATTVNAKELFRL